MPFRVGQVEILPLTAEQALHDCRQLVVEAVTRADNERRPSFSGFWMLRPTSSPHGPHGLGYMRSTIVEQPPSYGASLSKALLTPTPMPTAACNSEALSWNRQ